MTGPWAGRPRRRAGSSLGVGWAGSGSGGAAKCETGRKGGSCLKAKWDLVNVPAVGDDSALYLQ
jgi:hypothetical protein